eukprot:3822036-Amphidinium_carterae.2
MAVWALVRKTSCKALIDARTSLDSASVQQLESIRGPRRRRRRVNLTWTHLGGCTAKSASAARNGVGKASFGNKGVGISLAPVSR